MAGARPEQGQLTRDNDLSRTAETEAAIDASALWLIWCKWKKANKK